MEVHHPHHPTHKKKWSEYIIEFVMLFTAVTLGFFAENIREHISENTKKEELMKIVSLDLQRDLKQLEFHKADVQLKSNTIDSFFVMTNQDPKTINTRTYYWLLGNHLGYWNFNPNDRSRNDADSKGYFRDIENTELAYCMSKYNFFLLDFKAIEEEATQYRIKLKDQMEFVTEHEYYDRVCEVRFDKIPNKIGVLAPNKAAMNKVKYLVSNMRNIYKGFGGDIDSLNVYGKRAIELINSKNE